MRQILLCTTLAVMVTGCGSLSPYVQKVEKSEDNIKVEKVQTQNLNTNTDKNKKRNDEDRAIKLIQYKNESRYALLIGNNDYRDLNPLKNALNDSDDMAKALKRLDFEVTEIKNGTRSEINEGISKFASKLKSKKGVGMVFYAGHGLEVGGNNYLIPIDAKIEDQVDIKNEGIALNDLLYRLENAGNRLNIVVLDACRNNPFPSRSVSSRVIGDRVGLAMPPNAKGTYIAYSADIGEEASDGSGKNGIFTKHLLSAIEIEGVQLNDIFKIVRKGVEEDTDGKQSPASYDKTTGEFFFTIPNSKPNIISSEDIQRDFILTVNAKPLGSKIKVNGIDEYRDGIVLKGARYSIKVSQDGYFEKVIEINLDRNTVLNIDLIPVIQPEDKIIYDDKLVWTGDESQNLKKIKGYSFFEISYYGIPMLVRGEFETTDEYNDRLKRQSREIISQKNELLNYWLGEQNIVMKYEADEQYFEVNINRFLVFKLNIPRGEAQKFKDNVKKFNVYFEERNEKLWAIGVDTKVNQGFLKNDKIYSTKLNAQIEY